jgi:hypothetical protein
MRWEKTGQNVSFVVVENEGRCRGWLDKGGVKVQSALNMEGRRQLEPRQRNQGPPAGLSLEVESDDGDKYSFQVILASEAV